MKVTWIFKIRVVIQAVILMLGLAIGVATASASDNTSLEQLWQEIQTLSNRVSVLEARQSYNIPVESSSTYIFSGQGHSQTQPFRVSSIPWKISWRASMQVPGGSSFDIGVKSINNPENSGYAGSYGFYVSGNGTGTTYSYIPPGDYYLFVNAEYYTEWIINIRN